MSGSTTFPIAGVMQAATPVITRHEDRRLRVYDDANGKDLQPGQKAKGNPTVGVGCNLLEPGSRELLMKSGADYDAILGATSSLTNEQCDSILEHCMISTLEWMANLFPDFFNYSINRQVALLDMGFNLGYGRFTGFHHMIDRIREGNWEAAGQESLSSKWADQVGSRAYKDAEMLAQG